jgi:predicted Rossmann fold nucleotide-binding protein DprA/Smf involved in DNA uptake
MTPPQRQRRLPKPVPPPVSPPKEGERKNPERLYVIGGGEGAGERAELDLVTLIVALADPPPSATPEQAALLRLCPAPLSVAELSAYLNLPFSVVTVLLTEMLTAGLVQARAPIVRQKLPDRSLLEAVMHGLQKL